MCQQSIDFAKTTVGDVLKVNKSVKRLKLENISLKFPNLGILNNAKLIALCDALLNNLGNGAF